MGRRTIKAARRAFEDMAPALNPEMYKRLQQEIDQAVNGAVVMGTRFADERAQGVLSQRQEVLTELCRLRDAYKAIAAEARAGTATAREVTERMTQVRQELRAMDKHSDDLERATALVDRIEDDPEGWADETFYEKYPHMTPEFSF